MEFNGTCRQESQRGFTLTEMLIATLVVMVGLVAVAQLVPTSVMLNTNNRNDGTALVFAQKQLEALREQPLSNITFADPLGVTCPSGTTCKLGDPTQPKQLIGCPIALSASGTPLINFGAAPVAGYSFIYLDPNDPFNTPYDVRWAVITTTSASGSNLVTAKRFIVGVFRHGMQTQSLPITLDTIVEK